MSDIRQPVLTPVPPRSIAGIGAFRDQTRLLAALAEEFGAAPPPTAGFVQAGAITLSRLAPTRLLATGPRDANLPGRLTQLLDRQAAVTDQSDQWVSWHLSGPTIRDILARIVPIDLDPQAFPVGSLALTRGGHVDVRLWHVAEASYELSASRSYALDLRHALLTAGRKEAVLF